MNAHGVKERIAHEATEFFMVFLFIAPFVMSFAIYQSYMTHQSGSVLYVFGTALVNALVLSKIVLIEEIAGLGKRSDNRALAVSAVHKSIVFTALFIGFRGVENTVHDLLGGRTVADALYTAFVGDVEELLARSLVVLFAAVPFFALRETRRVLGPEAFHALFFGRARPQISKPSAAAHIPS